MIDWQDDRIGKVDVSHLAAARERDEARNARERMTMGDIARELILLGADGTYTQVHNRVRTWRIRGKLPEPDASVGDTPYWRRGTITYWLSTHRAAYDNRYGRTPWT